MTKPTEVTIGTPDYPVTVTLFNAPEGYNPPPGNTYLNPVEVDKEGCGHPECDAMVHKDGGACPWKSGTCSYCARSDCQKSHPKCDGLTYEQRNKSS